MKNNNQEQKKKLKERTNKFISKQIQKFGENDLIRKKDHN